ncbi:Universal stress protein A-like protein [Acorus calamus]|uniref:Universal stress protein A-like protein n=1 Tax=Acorus calamus TaxID=4465 RepID=A0AAV9FIU7_ACOCL|nr:Universal stress protein A-like protein [Acorus calamus]
MESPEPTRIMVAVNESSLKGYPHPSISSRSAFIWTIEKIVRSNFSGFKLLFLHAQVPDEDCFDDMDSIYASPQDFNDMNEKDKIRGIHLLEYFVDVAMKLGEVKRIQPDLLVVGSRGLGPFQRVFVGTVSEFCVKHAECPVITIKRKVDDVPQDPVDD